MKKKKETQNNKGMTRREFIVTTGAATGAALVTAAWAWMRVSLEPAGSAGGG